MSALGQKQTWRTLFAMSALPPNADIRRMLFDVSFGPKTDPCTATWRSARRKQKGRLVAVFPKSNLVQRRSKYDIDYRCRQYAP